MSPQFPGHLGKRLRDLFFSMIRYAFVFSFLVIAACSFSGEPEQNSLKEPVNAEKIYGYKCALCHGNDGKAGIAGAADLSKSMLSLDDRIAVISGGRGTMMPFREILSREEIEAVAAYIEQLRGL